MLKHISEKILNEELIDKNTALSLLKYDVEDLCKEADKIRKYFCGSEFDLCTIVNGKVADAQKIASFMLNQATINLKLKIMNY